MTLFVGTSGWAYKEWKPDFYPEGVPQKRWLEHYVTALSSCEINATFYRIQAEETIAKWAAIAPDGFRFTAKAYRGLSYVKSIAPDETRRALLRDFVASLGALGDHLGAVLVQLPGFRARDDEGLAALLEALPDGVSFAFEFRHPSWDDPSVHERIAAAGASLCISDTEGRVPSSLPPGPVGYVRLRAAEYTPEARAGWRTLLREEATARPVYAFAKHKTGLPASSPYGGIGLARWLAEDDAS
jgi:uncharacterized protein YecE (DUF72 family)